MTAILHPLPRSGFNWPSLGIALGLHLVLIFGLHFEMSERSVTSTRQLDITLLYTQPAPKPMPEPEYLAPVTQQGGMEAPPEATRIAPPAVPPAQTIRNADPPAVTPRRAPVQLTQRQPAAHTAPAAARAEPTPQPTPTHTPGSGQLLASVQTLSTLDTELQESLALYSKRPRTKYVTANTQEYIYANYMDAWRRKVERLGKLHYPAAARRQKLSGYPLLDVAINPDGSLHSIELLRSSGHTVLDDAAIQIARLGAPYAPLSAEIRAETDVLHIVRTWKFGKGGLLTSND